MNIRLVPNTGIQYHILPDIAAADVERTTVPVEVRQANANAGRNTLPSIRARRPHPEGDDIAGNGEESGFQQRSASARALFKLASSLKHAQLQGAWIPLPFDRGGAWVCLLLRQSPSGPGMYQAALAVDTTFESNGNPDGVSDGDEGQRHLNALAPRFWRSEATARAIAELVERSSTNPIDAPVNPLDLQLAIVAIAQYLKEGFDRGQGLHIELEPKPERGRTVQVDLVLDLGNSRTCALLLEETPSFRQERLELVYPHDPFNAHLCPFDSQFAFVSHEVLPTQVDQLEQGEPFRFLSQIVVGPPAGELLRRMKFDPQTVGMTSPKRYLWDSAERVPWQWRLADRVDPETGQPPVICGNVLRHMNPARPLQAPGASALPNQPDYPRYACAVWFLVEMLEQAFRQINTPKWRNASTRAPNSELRREIANLVIMYPAGLHSQEIANYRAACERACSLWASFRAKPANFSHGERVDIDLQVDVPAPKVHVVCDEALAIQACWLYGEVMHRYRGKASNLLKFLGREREGDGAKHSTLRVASLDIGGGTIDLAIVDYRVDPEMPAAIALTCTRRFHDGFSRAGDEVVRSLLELEVFRAIVADCGVDSARWDEVLDRDQSDEAVVLRRQLVRNVWQPIAKACLEASESSGAFTARMGDIAGVDTNKLAELEQRLFPATPPTKRLADARLNIDRKRMRHIIRLSIGNTIRECSGIVHQYQCDLLIVGGRPSSNPAIRQQIMSGMPVPPGQIVFLSEWRVGDWYPFVTSGQRVGDAKTCGVVGAAIVFRALYGYSGFRLRGKETEEPKPIIGYALGDRVDMLAKNKIEFAEDQKLRIEEGAELQTPVHWGTRDGILIALRRIAHAHAEAKPIYLLRLKSQHKRSLQANPVAQQQVMARLASCENALRPIAEVGQRIQLPLGAIEDAVKLESVKGEIVFGNGRSIPAEEAMELVLRTMIDGDGYWIDTGRFQLGSSGHAGGGLG